MTCVDNIKRGDTKSCGCLLAESRRTIIHGHARKGGFSSTYVSWYQMINRCTNPKAGDFKYYQGRGITVCERWRDFRNFLSDMGKRPRGTWLDRADNNGNYEPSNCRWATPTQQVRNRRNARLIEWDGKLLPLAEVCERTNTPYMRAFYRLSVGWPIERAFGPKERI
jgi:hypothetical protein